MRSELSIRGIYRDVIRDGQGVVVEDRGWASNTIVTRCRVLLASFLKNESAGGIRHLAVGSGDAAWDSGGAPASDPDATTGLTAPYLPPIDVADLEVAFLDAGDEVQTEASNRLQITATLGPGYPAPVPGLSTYPLREFGLFAELGGGDSMINSIRHPVIHKDAAATLIRVVRLYF